MSNRMTNREILHSKFLEMFPQFKEEIVSYTYETDGKFKTLKFRIKSGGFLLFVYRDTNQWQLTKIK